jgi:hypothetical protein
MDADIHLVEQTDNDRKTDLYWVEATLPFWDSVVNIYPEASCFT